MMFHETLKTFQPVVYQTLKNALLSKKTAHAYLFQGPKGSPKKETAYLLAQSILCEQGDGFACGTCNTCLRIKNNQYADMQVIDGNDTSIKKEVILKLQTAFTKTSLESAGHKFYVIDHIENATPDALNSLLKFLEEPTNNVTAILLSDQIDLVLPTIVSRCQVIHFKPIDQIYSLQMCRNLGMSEFDCYFLSQMVHSIEEIQNVLESEIYQHASYSFKQVLPKINQNMYDALLFLQTEAFPGKNKPMEKKALGFLLDMLLIYYKDCLKESVPCTDEWYIQQFINKPENAEKVCLYLEILMDTKDKSIRSSIQIALLVDQLLYRLKEV